MICSITTYGKRCDQNPWKFKQTKKKLRKNQNQRSHSGAHQCLPFCSMLASDCFSNELFIFSFFSLVVCSTVRVFIISTLEMVFMVHKWYYKNNKPKHSHQRRYFGKMVRNTRWLHRKKERNETKTSEKGIETK